jgi:hypothetical protein
MRVQHLLMGVIGRTIGFVLRTDTLHITPEILSLVARIDEFKGAWRALETLAPERLSALRRVATIESIGSSTRIEGSKPPLAVSGCSGSGARRQAEGIRPGSGG